MTYLKQQRSVYQKLDPYDIVTLSNFRDNLNSRRSCVYSSVPAEAVTIAILSYVYADL